MNFIKCIYLQVLVLSLLFASCHSHDHSVEGHTHNGDDHLDDSEPPGGYTFTRYGNNAELFIEFPALIKGKETQINAHLTDILSFKAIKDTSVRVRWYKEGQSEKNWVNCLSRSPGIFTTSIHCKETGEYNFQLIVDTDSYSDSFNIDGINVYETEEEAKKNIIPTVSDDEISFLKEQQWNTEFEMIKVRPQTINNIIHTSGEIKAVKGDEKYLVAKSSGIVYIKSEKLQEGRDVNMGENLLKVDSKGLLQSNMKEKFEVAKAKLDQTKSDFERAQSLFDKSIIGEKQYARRKMECEIAQSQFNTLKNSYNPGGKYIKAPISGFIKKVMIHDGQYVEEGTPLLEISKNKKLIMQADVSQKHMADLPKIQSANFKTPYMEEVQSIEDYNGRLVSYGKTLVDHTHLIPVLFELDNANNLVPGSFVEIFLTTTPLENQLVVPLSALLVDFNSTYVYVQMEGESFKKREIRTGISNGYDIQVLSGINEGDRVVTKGAYQIKMASMSSAIPSHGHEH